MKKQALTLSLIIPVYNEGRYIKECLDAISQQTIAPDEVLVIDNNTTDDSIKIAMTYPFVTVIKEKKQSLIAARNRGFNSAKSDILARIDADTRLFPDWIQRVKQDFLEDSQLGGVTGLGVNYHRSIYSIPAVSKMFARFYFWHIRGYLGVDVLWGANMAIRRTAWNQVKNDTCPRDHIVHEDQDISILLASKGGKVSLDSALIVKFDGSALQEWSILREYMQRRKSTKRYHRLRGTFDSPKMRHISKYRMVFYRLLTMPADSFFHITGLLYTPTARAHIKETKRK